MRIAHFIKWLRLRDGGTVRAVLDMASALAHRGHQVTLISADDEGVPSDWKLPAKALLHASGTTTTKPTSLLLTLKDPIFERGGRTMAQAHRDTPTQYLSRQSMLKVRQALRNCDVLHVHGMWANCNYQMIAAARAVGCAHIISPHGMLDDWSMSQGSLKKKIHLALLGTRALRSARAVHFTAAAELTQARKWLPKPNGHVVPLFFDTAPFKSLPGPSLAREHFANAIVPGQPTILFLSRLHVKKGVEHLIRAAAALHQHGKTINLLLAGPSDPPEYLSHLQSLAAALGIASHTHFLGMVTGSLKWSLYQAADLFVLPTSQENFGYVLLEALACGTPVITTKGVDIWPELEQSQGAQIVAPADLAQTIDSLMMDKPQREHMSRAGSAWAKSFLDESRIASAMEAMYQGK